MHVVMISKACIVGTYQRKLEELARFGDLRLSVIVPPYWRDSRGVTALERAYTAGYNLHVSPMWLNGHFHVHFYPRLAGLLRRLRPDLLHVDEEPYNAASWQAIRLARDLAIPACFFTWQNIQRQYPPPFSWFERLSYQRAAHAIAGNHEAVAVLRAKGYRGPASVVPQFGVDPDVFAPRPQDRRTTADGFAIGFAGGLVPEKGIDTLLEAVARAGGHRWHVQLAGEGADRGRLTALAMSLGIADTVRFVGRVPSTEMPGLYHSLDVLVLPSRAQRNWKEQFGRVLVEAMACGVPVVGSHSGEIPQVIGEAGMLFPEGDAQALGELLVKLCSDDALRADLGRRGRERVLARFTQAQVAAATRQVYLQMLQ
jgi:glycosyltransferase involved in cell wall biosynthesis